MERRATLWETMDVPGPPLLVPLLLLLLSKASPPAAAFTLNPEVQPQHKVLHLGEDTETPLKAALRSRLLTSVLFSPLRLAQGLWDGALQTQHG